MSRKLPAERGGGRLRDVYRWVLRFAPLGPAGVSVTAIAPGTIDTPQLAADARFAGVEIEEMKTRYARDTLVGRIGSAEEVAGVVAFLASDHGGAFSGQTVPVTGGRAE